jgi:Protein of unknown function (DUF3716)
MARPSTIKKIRKLPIISPRKYQSSNAIQPGDDTLDRPSRNIAVAAHLRGTEPQASCNSCLSSRKRHFDCCVVLQGFMSGRCTNCHWALDNRPCVFLRNQGAAVQVAIQQRPSYQAPISNDITRGLLPSTSQHNQQAISRLPLSPQPRSPASVLFSTKTITLLSANE